eukprot:scaffold5340_cov257-Pinguiococcus_pyrenoidosus.AAC.1
MGATEASLFFPEQQKKKFRREADCCHTNSASKTQGARIARIACPLEKKARGSLERSPMHRRLRTTSKVELLAT